MKHIYLAILALMLAASSSVSAVSLSESGEGQVALFPLFLTGKGYETRITIRNTDPDNGKAVRFVAKEPVNGRPIFGINVYLAASDSWTIRAYETFPSESFLGVRARFQPLDDSCVFYPGGGLNSAGNNALDRYFETGLPTLELPNRLNQGSIEIYEMGNIDSELAADCDQIAERWSKDNNIWFPGVQRIQNDGITPPSGNIAATLSMVDMRRSLNYQFDPIVFEDFSDQAIHTSSTNLVVPNLSNVSPATTTRLVELSSGTERTFAEREFDWSDNPIDAISSLLMTQEMSAEYDVDQSIESAATALMYMPTRPYYTDADGFYLEDGQTSSTSLFQESFPPQAGETALEYTATLFNNEGETADATSGSDKVDCMKYRGQVNAVNLSDQVLFSFRCEYGEGLVRVFRTFEKGRIDFDFNGTLNNPQGSQTGLPVRGYLMQTFLNQPRLMLRGDRNRGPATYSWVKPFDAK